MRSLRIHYNHFWRDKIRILTSISFSAWRSSHQRGRRWWWWRLKADIKDKNRGQENKTPHNSVRDVIWLICTETGREDSEPGARRFIWGHLGADSSRGLRRCFLCITNRALLSAQRVRCGPTALSGEPKIPFITPSRAEQHPLNWIQLDVTYLKSGAD